MKEHETKLQKRSNKHTSQKPVLTEEEKKENKKSIPHSYKHYCTSHSSCIIQATTYQINVLHCQVG